MSFETIESVDYNGAAGTERSPFLTVKLSWVAYLSEVWRFFVRLLIFAVIAVPISYILSKGDIAGKNAVNWPTLVALICAVMLTAYSVMYTASVRVFTNDGGVWMSRGVFPWEKGLTGVQWRDVGQAGFQQGALSWALRSYSMNVSHRFTTGSELTVNHVKHGNLFVQHVNDVMARIQQRGL